LDLVLDINYFSFSHPNKYPNPTHLSKHQTLSPNHQKLMFFVFKKRCSADHVFSDSSISVGCFQST